METTLLGSPWVNRYNAEMGLFFKSLDRSKTWSLSKLQHGFQQDLQANYMVSGQLQQEVRQVL